MASRGVIEFPCAADAPPDLSAFKHSGGSGVVVVGFIGRTTEGKGRVLNNVVGRLAFSEQTPSAGRCQVQVFHDASRDILYLHLVSAMDTAALAMALDKLQTEANGRGLSRDEVHDWISEQRLVHMQALLWMFLVSHVVLVVEDAGCFDLQNLRSLQMLAQAKSMLRPLAGLQEMVEADEAPEFAP